MGQLLTERICTPSGVIFSIKGKPHFGRALLSREVRRKSRKLFLFIKIAEKHISVTIHIITLVYIEYPRRLTVLKQCVPYKVYVLGQIGLSK